MEHQQAGNSLQIWGDDAFVKHMTTRAQERGTDISREYTSLTGPAAVTSLRKGPSR